MNNNTSINVDKVYRDSKRALAQVKKIRYVKSDLREDLIQQGALAILQGKDPAKEMIDYLNIA